MSGPLTPSAHAGMGPLPYPGGAAFRVWAPNAAIVAVSGTFNQWSAEPLAGEGNGYWSADIPGVKPGDEYAYVITHGGEALRRQDPYARQMTSSVGNSVVHDPGFDWGGAPYCTPSWDELVIYELHVGTFNDAPGGRPGHLPGVRERLRHLADLGVTAIQLMPPAEFPGGFSWGYNPSSPFAVESDYGGPHALKELIKAAHEHGLAVLCDVVYNHLGPSDLALWRFDGWQENDSGGIYFYNDQRAWTPWGERNRPDYGRPEVRQYLRDNALSWLEEYRMDGLRFDATAYIRNVWGSTDPAGELPDGWALLRWINDEINARQPWKISIAEDLRDDPRITRDTPDGAGFDAQWDGGFVHPIRAAIIPPDDATRDMNAVRAAIEHRHNDNAFSRVIYTESHDEDANGRARVPEEIWPGNAESWYSKKRSTLGAVLTLTSPGIPMIFQGQEMLEDRYFSDEDPLDWSRRDTFQGIVRLYHDLIALRRDRSATTAGLLGQHVHVHHVNSTDKVVAFHRYREGGPRDSTIVIVNLANQSHQHYAIGLPRPGSWAVRFNSDWSGYDASFGDHPASPDVTAVHTSYDGLPFSGSVGIAPYSALILSQDG